ncbi:MAG: hypothetical protein IKV09_02345 [Alistipes sp.]|nr:hypothetical protein [Alistipes sp.]
MGLFNFKRKEAEQIQQELEPTPTVVSIPKEKFTLEAKVEKNELPIFEVYRQLKEDWETKGYSDAKAFPETSYRDSNKKTIVERLSLLIQEGMLKYEDKIAEMETLIDQASQNGFIETLARYKRQKSILDRHLNELSLLAKDVDIIGAKTKVILTSYEMGFARGIASVGEDKVNNIMG